MNSLTVVKVVYLAYLHHSVHVHLLEKCWRQLTLQQNKKKAHRLQTQDRTQLENGDEKIRRERAKNNLEEK